MKNPCLSPKPQQRWGSSGGGGSVGSYGKESTAVVSPLSAAATPGHLDLHIQCPDMPTSPGSAEKQASVRVTMINFCDQ